MDVYSEEEETEVGKDEDLVDGERGKHGVLIVTRQIEDDSWIFHHFLTILCVYTL